MRLKKIVLKNYRLFDDVEIQFHPQMNVFVGENGSGKTAILEAIATAIGTFFHSFEELNVPELTENDARLECFDKGRRMVAQKQFPVEVTAIGEAEGKTIEWKRELGSAKSSTTMEYASPLLEYSSCCRDRLRDGDNQLIWPILACYGTGRFWDARPAKGKDASVIVQSPIDGYAGSLEGSAQIQRVRDWLRNMTTLASNSQAAHEGEAPELDAAVLDVVMNAVNACLSSASGDEDIQIQYDGSLNDLVVSAVSSGHKRTIPLPQMGGGFAGAVGLAADIACRMAVLNPHLKENVLKDTPGIVLIDEVELHLHPSRQRHLLKDLQSLFPKVQFIVSTHAPVVIHSVPRESVQIIKAQDPVQVVPSSIQTYGKDANGILKTVMHVQERPSDILDKMDQFNRFLDEKDLKKAEQVLMELESVLEDDPALAAMRVQLAMEEIELD